MSAAGPVTVVTGAGSGIGAAIAAELAGRNHRVVVTDRDESSGATHADAIGAAFVPLDVTDDEAVSATISSIAESEGRIGCWVNNAGISMMRNFLDVPITQLDATFEVNLRAVFVCGQAAARSMVEARTPGRIVNVASMAGKQGRVPYLADYVASKFGVVGLTQAMATELAPHGITVNSVCPGYVATSMQAREVEWEAELRGVDSDAVLTSWVEDTPLGRIEQPEDVARAVAFLLSEDAAFITGEALAVNGGAFMD